MADQVFQIKGVEKLRRALRDSPQIAAPLIRDALQKSAFDVVAKTIPITPIDTGALRVSIERGVIVKQTQATISSDKNYAIYVHEGTRYMQGRPFLKRGLAKTKQQIKKNFADATNKLMKAIKFKTESGL